MMRAAILAAGIGRRLALPEAPPKVLLRFGGESLLARHLAILSHCGIARIDICVGYCAGEIASELEWLAGGNDVASHMNPKFGNGSILSLRTLKDVFTAGDTVIFMDGDVLCDYRMIERLVAAGPANCFLMDCRVGPGDDLVRLCLRDGRLIDIHKRPTIAHDRAGEWIGFARFTPNAAAEIAAAEAHSGDLDAGAAKRSAAFGGYSGRLYLTASQESFRSRIRTPFSSPRMPVSTGMKRSAWPPISAI